MQTVLLLLFFVAATVPAQDWNRLPAAEHPSAVAAQDTFPVPADPAPSPGSTEIRAKLLEIFSDDDGASLSVSVKQVLDRGSSAPPLAAEDTLHIHATAFAENYPDRFDELKEQSTTILLISHSLSMTDGQKQSWRLRQVESDSNCKQSNE